MGVDSKWRERKKKWRGRALSERAINPHAPPPGNKLQQKLSKIHLENPKIFFKNYRKVGFGKMSEKCYFSTRKIQVLRISRSFWNAEFEIFCQNPEIWNERYLTTIVKIKMTVPSLIEKSRIWTKSRNSHCILNLKNAG